jgi:hypothetical protein
VISCLGEVNMGGAASTSVSSSAKKSFVKCVVVPTWELSKKIINSYGAKHLIRDQSNRAEEESKGDLNNAYCPDQEDSDADDDGVKKNRIKSAGLSIDTTPDKKALARVEYTPVGAEKDVYKYYCPLCMFYCQEVQETDCCYNYICYQCALQYVAGKGRVDKNIKSIPKSLTGVSCPHCATNDLVLKEVCKSAPVRLYHDTPPTLEQGDKFDNDPANENVPSFRRHCTSPVKIGDSFDDLKRKMLSFDNAEVKKYTDESQAVAQNKTDDHSSRTSTPSEPSEQNVLTEMPDVLDPANESNEGDGLGGSRRGSGQYLDESVPDAFEVTAAEDEMSLNYFSGLGGFNTPRLEGNRHASHENMRTPGEFGDNSDIASENLFPQLQQPMILC